MIHHEDAVCSVLLIDDEAISLDFVSICLEGVPGVSIHYDSHPELVVELARQLRATVVLVDLRMPCMDGIDVVRLLRGHSDTEQLPVIVLSSEEDAAIKSRAFAAGANDYLVKWPDGRELAARLKYHSDAYIARQQRDAAFASLRHSQEQLAASQMALHQAQKMEAIGQLTGGVAHDFNNVLQIIGGNLQLIKLLGGVSEKAIGRIDAALAGVERGAKLSSHLLAFARRQPLQAVVVNVGRVLRSMDEMMRGVMGPRAVVVSDIDEQLWSVKVDPSQLHNVILNLAINARDAMPTGGSLTIRAANLTSASPDCPAHLEPGEYVLIEVSDTGCGMPADILERACEPFYTTKELGQGTGLGLSMAYGFVKQSGGEMVLSSEPGVGTRIRIYLKRSAIEAETDAAIAPASLPGGPEAILVVEDEADVRTSTVELLSALGYHVFEAADALSAMNVIDSGVKIDLLFSDVMMPGEMSSLELSKIVRQRLPAAQILFTSGYAEGILAHDGSVDAGVNLLQKPYNADALSARIRHLLRRRRLSVAASS